MRGYSKVHHQDNQEKRYQEPIQSWAPGAAHLTNNQLTLEVVGEKKNENFISKALPKLVIPTFKKHSST